MTRQNILVVDDEAPMRKLLATNLKASGYGVRSAADGLEALQLLDEHQFDPLLLDVNMPVGANETRSKPSTWAPTIT